MVIPAITIILSSLVYTESERRLATFWCQGCSVCTARALTCYSHPKAEECIGGIKKTMKKRTNDLKHKWHDKAKKIRGKVNIRYNGASFILALTERNT